MRHDLGPTGVWASHLALVPAAEARVAAARIEDLGYGALWIGEADGREVLTHAAVLLGATTTIPVATGIANLWARDAQAMINAARTLAEAYDGRFVLGIGASHTPLVARRGHDYAKPYSATVEYLEAMGRADYTSPRPAHEPDVVLAALGPRMLALAGERTAGAHTFLVPVEHSRRARATLGEGPLLAPEQACVIAPSRDGARAVADRHLDRYLSLPNYRRNLERLGWDEAAFGPPVSDDLFDALIAWGGPEEVAARVRAHHDAGADHVAIHPLTESRERLPLRELEVLAEVIVP